jgi:hypothetical protein
VRPDATSGRPVYYRHRRSERGRILANAQHRLDQISAGSLPFELKIDAMFDVLQQVGFDLDRLDRRDRLTRLSAGRGSVAS